MLIHETLHTQQKLFALVTKAENYEEMDEVLGLPLLHLSREKEVVGLPGIDGRKLYILPVSGGSKLLHVTWTIQFL